MHAVGRLTAPMRCSIVAISQIARMISELCIDVMAHELTCNCELDSSPLHVSSQDVILQAWTAVNAWHVWGIVSLLPVVCVVHVSSIDVVCCLFLSARNHSSYSQIRPSVARKTKTRRLVLEESFSLQQLSWEWLPLRGSLLREGHDFLYCHVFPPSSHTHTNTQTEPHFLPSTV